MSWLDKILPPRINKKTEQQGRRVPEGLWVKCPSCEAVLYNDDLVETVHVCPKCSHHMRLNARARIDALLDTDGRVEIGEGIRSTDRSSSRTAASTRKGWPRPRKNQVNLMRWSS